jgi:hypothetical protein
LASSTFLGGVARVRWRLAIASVLVASCLFFTASAAAQNTSGRLHLTTSPLPISLKAKPGETVETELRVRNSGPNIETLKVGLMKFSAFGEEGKPKLEERGEGDDYFDWVKFSKSEFEAPPSEWQSLKMTIALPKTAAFGYYYAVTFSRANAETAEGDLETAVRGGTATLVLLEADVPGAKRELSIQDFQTERRTYEFLPARFKVKLKNTGNIHAAPTGTIFINRGKTQVATVNVNATKGNILPKSNRIFTAEWADGFPSYQLKQEDGKVVLKDGQPAYELQWELGQLKKLRFGKYSAMVVMIYDNGQRDVPLEATVSFWVIPWRLIFFAIAIPLVPALLVYFLMRRRMKRQLQKRKS